MVLEVLFEVLGQVSGQRGREVEQNIEALAAEASLACLSLALDLQSQGTPVHLAACWNAEKGLCSIVYVHGYHTCNNLRITCGDGCLLTCLCGEVVAVRGGG